jgi:hypothetical protein
MKAFLGFVCASLAAILAFALIEPPLGRIKLVATASAHYNGHESLSRRFSTAGC